MYGGRREREILFIGFLPIEYVFRHKIPRTLTKSKKVSVPVM
jgi:hypothetical protein